MQLIHAKIDGEKEVTIIHEGNGKPCYMQIKYVGEWDIISVDDNFPNLRVLSTVLACELLYGPAVDLLHTFNVPAESDLWFLNHSGYSAHKGDTNIEVFDGI